MTVPRRGLILLVCLGAVAAMYVFISVTLVGLPPPHEQPFDRLTDEPASLQVYVEVLAFDPIRDALDVRIDFATSVSTAGSQFAGVANRDMLLRIADGEVEQQVKLVRGQAMSPVSMTIDVGRGSILDYPFDRYSAQLAIAAYDIADLPFLHPLSLHVIVWSRLAAWNFTIGQQDQPIIPGGVDLMFRVQRLDLHRFFAVTLYAAMTLMGCIGLAVSSLFFLRIRRIDTTMAAVLSAMIFSLPALRNIMPGAPPLGVHADSMVFLWAELAVVVGLTLVIVSWIQHGDAP
jgi:hypothetical protein